MGGHRRLIFSMAKRDIASRYVGSLLGFIWAFIHPAIMIFVFWVVFSVGFKSRPIQNVPFVVWLTAGMAPWFIFADIITGSAGVIVSNAHLIKKTLFPSQILPLVRVVSSILTHGVFLAVLLVLILFQGMPVSLYYFQFVYYLIALCVLALGFSLILSAMNVFIRDVNQVTAVLVQIGFWATPIFWDIKIMPEKVRFFLKLNPMFYIIQGYRDSFIENRPFWDHPLLTLYFWSFSLFFLGVGVFVFRKLKPHFADAL
jgi:lipopolysaccharide transport system permease protein/teichoic acid transport system permease protein